MLLHCNIYALASQYHNFLIQISFSSSFCSIFPFPNSASIAPLSQPHYRLTLVRSRNGVSAIFHFSLFTFHSSLFTKRVEPLCQPRYRLKLVRNHNRVSAIFHSSLFTKRVEPLCQPRYRLTLVRSRNGVSHSSFFILHSSFIRFFIDKILH